MNTEIKSAKEILSDWNWDCEWMQKGLTQYERILKAMEAYHNQFKEVKSNAGNVSDDEIEKLAIKKYPAKSWTDYHRNIWIDGYKSALFTIM